MEFLKKINVFFKRLGSDHIGEYTAQCAYYTFLSFIPFIILLLSLIKYVNIEKDTLASIFEAILPNIMKNSVLDIIQEVYSKSIETISISAIFLLWSASNSFYALTKGLSSIYKGEDEENYIFLRLKGIVGAVIALMVVVVILILLVFGNSLEALIDDHFHELSGVFDFIISVRAIFSISLMFVIFLFMYRFFSGRKGIGFKNCMLGAAFTSIAWYLVSYFFSIYVDIFTNFSVIYGSLATIILILMWLYAIIYVIFLGAEINMVTEKWVNFFYARLKNKRLKVKLLK